MRRKKSSLIKRALLLGSAAVALFIIVLFITYPYDRTIEWALGKVQQEGKVTITKSDMQFFFPNQVIFRDLRLVPVEQRYNQLEMTFRKLKIELGVKALVARTLRVKFSGELESGDPNEGNYAVSGTMSLRNEKGEGVVSPGPARVVELESVRFSGTNVNFVIDGLVRFIGDSLNPALELNCSVERFAAQESASYAVANLLAFVQGCLEEGTKAPATFVVSGHFPGLKVTRETGEMQTTQ